MSLKAKKQKIVDKNLCIICQTTLNYVPLSSKINGIQKIIQAAKLRNDDEVLKRINGLKNKKKFKSNDVTDFSDNKNYCYIVDVMANVRKLNLKNHKYFYDLVHGFCCYLKNSTKNVNRIDLIFDSYFENSLKESERVRRKQKCEPLEVDEINDNVSIPVQMDKFWSSNINKIKLQNYIKSFIIKYKANYWAENVEICLSAVIHNTEETPCVRLFDNMVEDKSDLRCHQLEEADTRIMIHILDILKNNLKHIVVLSGDTDIFILLLHHWSTFKEHGILELWMKMGVGATTRHNGIHKIGPILGIPLCDVLPAIHHLTGADYTSKFGTKLSALKNEPQKYLQEFGNPTDSSFENTLKLAELFLCKIFKKTNDDVQNMDQLRFYIYRNSENSSLIDLPPTSKSIRQHILRAYFHTYIYKNCLNLFEELNPLNFGYVETENGVIKPKNNTELRPSNLQPGCKCKNCKKKCSCFNANISCCIYCSCNINSCCNAFSKT